MTDDVVERLAQVWESVLPANHEQLSDADMVVLACLGDLRVVIETDALPTWYTIDKPEEDWP